MTKASYGKYLLCTYVEFFLLRGNSFNNSTWLLASLGTILGSRKFGYNTGGMQPLILLKKQFQEDPRYQNKTGNFKKGEGNNSEMQIQESPSENVRGSANYFLPLVVA